MCREAGIEVPIIPGLKIISRKRHLQTIPRTFHCEIPAELSREVEKAAANRVKDVGVEWARQQTQELLEKNVPAVHFYIMQDSRTINALLATLDL
jgi:methylenetetrahydrofolate reductase (NADPH)